MDKDKLMLADGTEITLEGSQGIGVLLFSAESRYGRIHMGTNDA